jgi:hypothetical protein
MSQRKLFPAKGDGRYTLEKNGRAATRQEGYGKNFGRVCANAQSTSAAKGNISTATSGVGYLTLPYERKTIMLYTIAVVLVILWLLGLVTSYTMGGLIHVLLVIAIVVVLLRVISGRSPL